MSYLKINSIYLATEGEGVFIGTPQVFVRFQGCSIACINCDSKDTWSFDQGFEPLSVLDVIKEIEEVSEHKNLKRVSITGGDPLHPSHNLGLIELIKELKSRGYYVNIEAAGTRLDSVIFDLVNYISLDYKSPSTGVKTKISLLKKVNEQFPFKFQIKTVVQDKEDFEDVYFAYQELLAQTESLNFDWCLTPSYLGDEGKVFLRRFQDLIDWNTASGSLFRIIGQQHKWVYGPSVKNV